jgi:hypothetical protein
MTIDCEKEVERLKRLLETAIRVGRDNATEMIRKDIELRQLRGELWPSESDSEWSA